MPMINPYLNFSGTTEEAFNFYRSVFGGEFAMLMRYKDSPESAQMNEHDKEKIMHIALPIGHGTMLMGTDALESMGFKVTNGNNFYVSVGAESEDEANRLFNGLSEGGKIEIPLQKIFWGALYGSFADRYDIKWMINYELQKNKRFYPLKQFKQSFPILDSADCRTV